MAHLKTLPSDELLLLQFHLDFPDEDDDDRLFTRLESIWYSRITIDRPLHGLAWLNTPPVQVEDVGPPSPTSIVHGGSRSPASPPPSFGPPLASRLPPSVACTLHSLLLSFLPTSSITRKILVDLLPPHLAPDATVVWRSAGPGTPRTAHLAYQGIGRREEALVVLRRKGLNVVEETESDEAEIVWEWEDLGTTTREREWAKLQDDRSENAATGRSGNEDPRIDYDGHQNDVAKEHWRRTDISHDDARGSRSTQLPSHLPSHNIPRPPFASSRSTSQKSPPLEPRPPKPPAIYPLPDRPYPIPPPLPRDFSPPARPTLPYTKVPMGASSPLSSRFPAFPDKTRVPPLLVDSLHHFHLSFVKSPKILLAPNRKAFVATNFPGSVGLNSFASPAHITHFFIPFESQAARERAWEEKLGPMLRYWKNNGTRAVKDDYRGFWKLGVFWGRFRDELEWEMRRKIEEGGRQRGESEFGSAHEEEEDRRERPERDSHEDDPSFSDHARTDDSGCHSVSRRPTRSPSPLPHHRNQTSRRQPSTSTPSRSPSPFRSFDVGAPNDVDAPSTRRPSPELDANQVDKRPPGYEDLSEVAMAVDGEAKPSHEVSETDESMRGSTRGPISRRPRRQSSPLCRRKRNLALRC